MSDESKLVADPANPEVGSRNPEVEAEVESAENKGKAKEVEKFNPEQEKARLKLAEMLYQNNEALQKEMGNLSPKELTERLKGMKIEDLMTGLAVNQKNKKDMASYKFWSTQPVARFDEPDKVDTDGEIQKEHGPVPENPSPLLNGFEWVTMDLTDGQQMHEVYELLTGHYVEDSEAMFRFNYSASFLDWAVKSPGWLQNWHVGVRVVGSKKLVAFISGIPTTLKIRNHTVKTAEINFLCIHKKLRAKRLAPVLIKEITRRCNQDGVWSAIYTAGVLLPKPVSTCRYFHRSLDWLKLYEVGFSPLPTKSTKQRQISKYALPSKTSTVGLREMEEKDIAEVGDLLRRYLNKFDLAPVYDDAEVSHWLLHKETGKGERVIWTYVVEDPETHKVTDFFSFYLLESSVIGNSKHTSIRAAYLFYYGSETAFQEGPDARKNLKVRLNGLMNDALILAKSYKFDVFNALTLLDNTLFLEEQKFGPGDGQLHYYLFNWRTGVIAGGITPSNDIDESGSGVGVVML